MVHENLNILVYLRECSDPRPPATTITRGAGISERGLRHLPNPADLSALEEALRLKESVGATITVLAIGEERLDDLLRLAASLGADRCIRFWDHGLEGSDAVAEARVLARIIKVLEPNLVFTGSRLLDRGDDPVPALAAAMRMMPCLAGVTALTLTRHGIQALCKADRGGRQEIAASYGSVVQFEDIAVPRYPSTDDLLAAIATSVEHWDLTKLGLPFWEVGALGSYLSLGEYGTPRPDPVRVVTPDAELPAFERIISLLSGGIKAREGKLHSGSPGDVASGIWKILVEEGLAT